MRPLHILMLVGVAAIWGFNFVVIKLGLADFPPLLFSALRFLFAGLPLAFFVRRPNVSWPIIIGIGLVLGVIKFSMLFVGMDIGVSAGLASLLLQAQAFFTVILAVLIYGEKPRRMQLAGMVVAFAGIAIIGTTVDRNFSLTGLALTIGAAMAWAVSNMLMKKAGKVDMLSLMIWVSLVPPIPLALISLVFEGWHRDLAALEGISMTGIGAVAYIAYLTTVLGFGLWGAMIRRYGVGQVAPFSLLVPIFGMSSSALVLGEAFSPIRIFAAGLIVAGLILNVFNPSWIGAGAKTQGA